MRGRSTLPDQNLRSGEINSPLQKLGTLNSRRGGVCQLLAILYD
jgi:hypothetical protein